MARTINQKERSAKRGEILDTAQLLVLSKGYERMAIGDILEALRISSGAFYHYFDSKPAVLEALVERIRGRSGEPLQRVVDDSKLNAIDKLQAFFSTLDALRRAEQQTILEVMKVWYADHNAIVRQKVDVAVRAMRVPMLANIVAQGVREGRFASHVAERTAEVLSSLIEGMGGHHAEIVLAYGVHLDERRFTHEVVEIHTAYMEAIERALQAPENALKRIGPGDVAVWSEALRRRN